MLEQARELAARGHQPLMIEAMLRANGFPEAAEWIDQPHIRKELKNIADAARKQAACSTSAIVKPRKRASICLRRLERA